jgi:cysteine-rich repeat protein
VARRDDGNTTGGDGCSSSCRDEEGCDGPCCGDGHVDPGEDCDDGNIIGGDGCSETCKAELIL